MGEFTILWNRILRGMNRSTILLLLTVASFILGLVAAWPRLVALGKWVSARVGGMVGRVLERRGRRIKAEMTDYRTGVMSGLRYAVLAIAFLNFGIGARVSRIQEKLAAEGYIEPTYMTEVMGGILFGGDIGSQMIAFDIFRGVVYLISAFALGRIIAITTAHVERRVAAKEAEGVGS